MFDPLFEQVTMAMVKSLEKTQTFENALNKYDVLRGDGGEKEFLSLFLLQGKNNVSEVKFV
jgi:hypothetical protein